MIREMPRSSRGPAARRAATGASGGALAVYDDLLGDGSVAAAVLDTELRVLTVNEAAAALLGYVPERVLGDGRDDAVAFSQDWLRGELAALLRFGVWRGDLALHH